MVLRSVIADVLDAVFPPRCAGCQRRGHGLCAACAATLRPAPPAPTPPAVDWWTACWSYDNVGRELVARAKYRNERHLLYVVVPALVDAIAAAPRGFDVMTWAPASAARLRAHGVDHGEVLARAVARALHHRAALLLRRERGPAQTGRDARARREGPRLHAVRDLEGVAVLVVDDVATTGGTVSSAARALRAAGANRVFAATIARTPPPETAASGPAYTRPDISVSSSAMGRTWTSSSSAST